MAPAVTIGRIRVHKAGVVAPEFAVGVAHGSKPPCASASGQAELETVILADGFNCSRTLGAEWHGVQIFDAGRVGNNYRPVEYVGEGRSRIANVETQVICDGHVLDCVVKAFARVTGLEDQVRRYRPIRTSRELVALHWLHVGLDGRVTRVRLGCTEIHVFNKASAHAWSRTRGRTPGARRQCGSDAEEVESIQGVHAIVPVVTAERAAGQTKLHDVEELAVAGIDLQLAVMKHVIGAADARSNFVAPAKVKIGEPDGIESRVLLMVQADPNIQSQSAVPDRPGILNIDSLICRFRGAGIGNGVAAGKEIAILTHTESASITRLDRVAGRGTGNRGISDAPMEVNFSGIRGLQDVVLLRLPEVAPLEAVASPKISDDIRHIGMGTPALVRIKQRGKVTRNVRKPVVIERGVCRERIVIDVSGRRIQRSCVVEVPDAARRTARRVVVEEVPITAGDQQRRCRVPIAAEAVYRRRAHNSQIRTKRSWIDGGAVIRLPECTVRRAELARQTRIGVVPASKQTHGVRYPVIQSVV